MREEQDRERWALFPGTGLSPITGAPYSGPHLNLILPKTPPSTPSHWGLRLQHRNLGGHRLCVPIHVHSTVGFNVNRTVRVKSVQPQWQIHRSKAAYTVNDGETHRGSGQPESAEPPPPDSDVLPRPLQARLAVEAADSCVQSPSLVFSFSPQLNLGTYASAQRGPMPPSIGCGDKHAGEVFLDLKNRETLCPKLYFR